MQRKDSRKIYSPDLLRHIVAGVTCCKFCKAEKCALQLYRCVLLYLTLVSCSACILWRGSWVLVSFCLSVHQHVPHNFKLSRPCPEWGECFLPGTVVFYESFALLWKLTRALNLSVFIMITQYWIICTFDWKGWRNEKGYYIFYFHFMQHIAAITVFIFLLYLLSMVLI